MVTTCCTIAIIFVLVCLLTLSANALPSFETREQQEKYLTHYAYMGPKSMNLRLAEISNPDERFRMAVEKFQMMAGLNVTGTVDKETQKMMEMPRCGMADEDMMGMTARKRRRRYAASGSAWRKRNLTYRINNVTPDLSRGTVFSDIRKALKQWSDNSPITFTEVTSQERRSRPDINIDFVTGDHGDGSPFDGPGRVLAHAFFPQNGRVHFDDGETWTSERASGGTDLLQVAIHEFGHTLGLGHSDVREAIMYPFYRGFIANVALRPDDIAGIQYIYGSRTTAAFPGRSPVATGSPPTRRATGSPPTRGATGSPPTRATMDGPICRNFSLDAFFPGRARWHLFKGSQYYQLDETRIATGYPKPISSEWQGLPNDIDTAFNDAGLVYFFKGEQVWMYRLASRELQTSYPQRISDRFKGLPNNLDAAFVWSGNNKLYLTKGDRYYRVSNFRSNISSVDRRYPYPLSYWKGLPAKIDAAFSYSNSRTYFIRGDDLYRYNDVEFKVDNGYPIKMNRIWQLCPSGYSVESNLKMMEQEMAEGKNQFVPGGNDQTSDDNGASGFYVASLRLPITINVMITLSLLLSP